MGWRNFLSRDPFVIERSLASGRGLGYWKARQHPEWGRWCACCRVSGTAQGAASASPAAASQTPSLISYFLYINEGFYLRKPKYDGERDRQAAASAHRFICMRIGNREAFLVPFLSPTIDKSLLIKT